MWEICLFMNRKQALTWLSFSFLWNFFYSFILWKFHTFFLFLTHQRSLLSHFEPDSSESHHHHQVNGTTSSTRGRKGEKNRSGSSSKCYCNKYGSYNSECSGRHKECICRPGVGGRFCDRCDPDFWGLHKISEGNPGCLGKAATFDTHTVSLLFLLSFRSSLSFCSDTILMSYTRKKHFFGRFCNPWKSEEATFLNIPEISFISLFDPCLHFQVFIHFFFFFLTFFFFILFSSK